MILTKYLILNVEKKKFLSVFGPPKCKSMPLHLVVYIPESLSAGIPQVLQDS